MSNNKWTQLKRIIYLTSSGIFLDCLLGGLTGADILGLVVFIYNWKSKND